MFADISKHISVIEKFIHHPNKWQLKFLNNVFRFIIPFNAPHGIKLTKLTSRKSECFIPYKRANLNHVKGVHACALATVGEYCAGMCLLQNFKFSKYRLVISSLNIEYTYQAKTDIVATASLSSEKVNKMKTTLKENGVGNIEMVVELKDKKKNLVAKVTSIWQIKDWDKVRTKI